MLYREQSSKLFDILKTELEENKAEKVFKKLTLEEIYERN